jgi:hypothetical membrane protein
MARRRVRNALNRPQAVAGVVVPPLFYAVMIVLGLITPGYNAISRFGSELSLGRLGGFMIANFIVMGLAELAFALGLWRVIGARRSGRLGTVMVGVIGAAFVVAGVFVTDPNGTIATFHGALHFGAAITLFFISFPIAGLAMAVRFRDQRVFAAYSALTGIATPLLFVATFLSGDLLGLFERVLIAIDLIWLTVLAGLSYVGVLAAPLPPRRTLPRFFPSSDGMTERPTRGDTDL